MSRLLPSSKERSSPGSGMGWVVVPGETGELCCTQPFPAMPGEGLTKSSTCECYLTANRGGTHMSGHDTAANQVIKVGILNTVDTAGNLALSIDYDESAAVTQAASEA